MPNSSRFIPALVGIGLLALGAVFGLKALRTAPPAQQTGSQTPPDPAPLNPPKNATDDSEPHEVTPAERASLPPAPTVLKPVSRTPSSAQSAANTEPRSEPSAYTRQLVAGLTNLDLSHGPLTQQQAEQWKQTLQTLTAQGAAAIPAIREFLDQNQEVNFGSAGGANVLGQNSMRSAFINALGQIGGPEGTAAMLQTMQSSTLPSEIAQLAQLLDQQAPGQHRQEAINAANEVLNMASSGQLPANWDVGTLFKVLQTYGDTSTAATLDQLPGPWKYYATMSLAGMEDGQGVPTLVHETQDPSGGGKRDFAYQMLAQVAAQYPDASAALLDQAKASQIPDAAWRKIAAGLAGDQYNLGEPPPTGGQSTDAIPGLKTYHINSGNQNFYSLPFAGDSQVQQRIAIIDQLLAATSNPAAVSALQGARNTLTGLPVK